MGTNYKMVEKSKRCEHCGHSHEDAKIHVGKSSWGWCFSLRVDDEYHCPADYYRLMENGTHLCEDEYGELVSLEALRSTIEDRKGHSERSDDDYRKMGYASRYDFFTRNNAAPGPNGLLRHSRDGRHCVVNGEGTWDGIRGYFS